MERNLKGSKEKDMKKEIVRKAGIARITTIGVVTIETKKTDMKDVRITTGTLTIGAESTMTGITNPNNKIIARSLIITKGKQRTSIPRT